MGILMVISLFTARVLLDKLGVEDYGIYNVVGGVAGMFTFFQTSLTNASQRSLNIELGRNDIDGASRIFRQHLTLYIIICIGVVVAAETIGLWFVCNKLVIPPERWTAAFWVYQFVILSLCTTLIGIIFGSEIIAHEDMSVYSFIGIYEGVSKLLICYVVSICTFDRLIVYGLLLLLVTLSSQTIYILYCKRHYAETVFKLLWDKTILKETSSLIGWNTWGTLVWAISDTGVNILINMFFGPAVNAARALSFQISNAVNNFATNFQVSVRPQITKSYAANNYDYLFKLLYSSSKYSFFLLWVFSLPISFRIDCLMGLWLKEVPMYASTFTIWCFIATLIYIVNNPLWTLALSTGRLERYTGLGGLITLSIFPISYIFLKLGYSPISVFVILVVLRGVHLIVTLRIIHDYVKYSYKDYFNKVIIPIFLVILVTTPIAYLLSNIFCNGIIATLSYCALVFFINVTIIWMAGVSQNEKNLILCTIKSKFHKAITKK